MKNTFVNYLVLLILLLLCACGGSGGSNSGSNGSRPPAGSNPPAASSLSGVAAVGTPIVNGAVSIICASGSSLTTTTSSMNGAWQVNLSGQTLPCAVEVSSGTVNGVANTTPYHSIAITTGTVNVTPLTDLIVSNLVGTATPLTWFAGLSANPMSLSNITQAKINTSLGNMVAAFSGLTQLSANNPITTPFTPTPGNVIDNMLSALSAAAASNNVTYADLLSYAASPTFSVPVTGFNTSLTTAYSNILLAAPPLAPGYYILNNASAITSFLTDNKLLLVQVTANNRLIDLTDSAIWSSSNPSVVTVSNSPGSNGNLTWHTAGNVVISAQLPNTSVTATTNIVSSLSAGQILMTIPAQQVAPPGSQLQLYSSFSLTYGGKPSVDVTSSARWTSLDTSIADVSQVGVVHVKSPGIVRIISEYNGLVASSIIYVPDVKMFDENTPLAQTPLLGGASIVADSQNRAFAWWTRGNNSIVYVTRTAQGIWSSTTSLALPNTQSIFTVTSNRNGALLVLSPQNTQATGNHPLMYSIGSTTTGLSNFQLAATLSGYISNIEAGIDQAGNGFAVYTTPQGDYSQHYDAASGVWGQPMLISGVTTGIHKAFATCPNGDGHLLWIQGGANPPYGAYLSTYHANTSNWDTPLQIGNVADHFFSTGSIVCNSKNAAAAVLESTVTTNGVTARSVKEISYLPGTGWGQITNLFPNITPNSLPSPSRKSYLVLTDNGLIGISCDDTLMGQMWVAIFDPLNGWSSTSQFTTSYYASAPEFALFSPRPSEITVAYLGLGFAEDFLLRTYTSGTGWGAEIGNIGYSYFGDPNASYKFAIGADGNGIVIWTASTLFPLPAGSQYSGSYLLANNLVFP